MTSADDEERDLVDDVIPSDNELRLNNQRNEQIRNAIQDKELVEKVKNLKANLLGKEQKTSLLTQLSEALNSKTLTRDQWEALDLKDSDSSTVFRMARELHAKNSSLLDPKKVVAEMIKSFAGASRATNQAYLMAGSIKNLALNPIKSGIKKLTGKD